MKAIKALLELLPRIDGPRAAALVALLVGGTLWRRQRHREADREALLTLEPYRRDDCPYYPHGGNCCSRPPESCEKDPNAHGP